MNIQTLNKRITLQYKTKTPDNLGGFVNNWSDAYTVFAAIWQVSANEQLASMGQAMTISHKIRIRYKKILKSSWRVKYNERYFNIVSIINANEDNKVLDLMCKEVV